VLISQGQQSLEECSVILSSRHESSRDMLELEISSLQSENAKLQDMLAHQKAELSRSNAEHGAVRIERDLLRSKVSV